jgi:hypothetical protein
MGGLWVAADEAVKEGGLCSFFLCVNAAYGTRARVRRGERRSDHPSCDAAATTTSGLYCQKPTEPAALPGCGSESQPKPRKAAAASVKASTTSVGLAHCFKQRGKSRHDTSKVAQRAFFFLFSLLC